MIWPITSNHATRKSTSRCYNKCRVLLPYRPKTLHLRSRKCTEILTTTSWTSMILSSPLADTWKKITGGWSSVRWLTGRWFARYTAVYLKTRMLEGKPIPAMSPSVPCISKAKLGVTDRELVDQIAENPYMQYFIGYSNCSEPPTNG